MSARHARSRWIRLASSRAVRVRRSQIRSIDSSRRAWHRSSSCSAHGPSACGSDPIRSSPTSRPTSPRTCRCVVTWRACWPRTSSRIPGSEPDRSTRRSTPCAAATRARWRPPKPAASCCSGATERQEAESTNRVCRRRSSANARRSSPSGEHSSYAPQQVQLCLRAAGHAHARAGRGMRPRGRTHVGRGRIDEKA